MPPRHFALAPRSSLQIRPFVFNNFQDAPPATLFFSCFCIVARGWPYPSPSADLKFCFNRLSDKDSHPVYSQRSRRKRAQRAEGSILATRMSQASRSVSFFSANSVLSVLRQHRCARSNLSRLPKSLVSHRSTPDCAQFTLPLSAGSCELSARRVAEGSAPLTPFYARAASRAFPDKPNREVHDRLS